MIIPRPNFLKAIQKNFDIHAVAALLGPRQCGKTTIAELYGQAYQGSVHRFDLEDPLDLAQLENPKLALDPLAGLVIIDEIQLRPHLFPYLRVLADRKPECQYLILGSASRDLIKQSSETLAGRIGYQELTPLQVRECGVENTGTLWLRGGYPKSYLAASLEQSIYWRKSYIRTFLERDLGLLGFHVTPELMRRLWIMLAHYHGNVLNYSEFARSLALSDTTIRRYIDMLEGAFMVRCLKPWYVNIKKRQVKSPKIYIRDSGLLHTLLDIETAFIQGHPKVGASWEGFGLETIIQSFAAEPEECYFWCIQGVAELDLLIIKNGKCLGFEFKYSDHPSLTKSMCIAQETLGLDHLTVVIPGDSQFLLKEGIEVRGLSRF